MSINLSTEFVPLFESMYTSINDKLVIEFNAGRLTDKNYAGVLASALRDIVTTAISSTITNTAQNIDNDIKLANHTKQLRMLESQAAMLEIDQSYKDTMVQKDLTLKTKQADQLQADIDFNISKKAIMEWTRKDNVRMQAAREFSELLKYISAAGAVPSETDFTNIRNLINNINSGVVTEDAQATITDPTSGTSYQKV